MTKTMVLAVVLSALAAFGQDAKQLSKKPICEAAFTVPARGAKTCTFDVQDGWHQVQLEGKFNATGGMRNSIAVWVMNDDQFVNWQNRHPVKAMYKSGLVTQSTVKVFLAEPGKYHVVFNNDFSIITPKAVETNLTLRYAR